MSNVYKYLLISERLEAYECLFIQLLFKHDFQLLTYKTPFEPKLVLNLQRLFNAVSVLYTYR